MSDVNNVLHHSRNLKSRDVAKLNKILDKLKIADKKNDTLKYLRLMQERDAFAKRLVKKYKL